ncbi:MAG: adenylyltransferase/cytidyltransferase family protein [Clostridia bacterium]|nr:adenylyltransferase/cytidyltransferase family protein [Clostridia bacterium]
MSNIINNFDVGDQKIYLERAICYFFDKDNFERLLYASKKAKLDGRKFYVGLYSNDILSKNGQKRIEGITDSDRIKLVEALDFVDGAIIIDSLKKEDIKRELENKLLKQKLGEYQNIDKTSEVDQSKKYEVGYASGGFDTFHKGHLEHIIEMLKQCKTIIIAVNSDEMLTNGYKNKKIVNNQETRRLILSHIKGVNIATITDEYDKLKAIDKVRALCGENFQAIFVGSDWKGDERWNEFERKFKELGIEVIFTDRPKETDLNFVSSSIIREYSSSKKEQSFPRNPIDVENWRKKLDEERKVIDYRSGSDR